MKSQYLIIILPLLALLASCSDDDNPAGDNNELITLATNYSKAGNYQVGLMSAATLETGYNKIYLDVKSTATGEQVPEASINLLPMMNMTSMSHSAPVEDPANTPDDDGYYEGAVVFTMPGNEDESWTMAVAINQNGVPDTVNFDLSVTSPDEARIVSFVSPLDGKSYFISLVEPSAPVVGLNDIELTVHYKESMINFPADDDVAITIYPEMPSMGHSSPNNVDPVSTGNGHYKGTVNFTMTGWWRINLTLSKNDELMSDELYFDVTFQ